MSGTNPDEYTPADAAITLINPTRTGYSFSGWQGTGLSGTVPSVTIPSGSTGNRDYTAVWTANSYTVSFVTNGGTGTMADQRFTYDVPQALSPLGYTREGFTFVGWYTNSDGTGTSYEDGESVRNLTDRNGVTVSLYAVWTEKPTQTITFAPNGGAEAAYHQHVIRGIGTTLSPNQFTRVGYTFGGWNTASNGSGSSYTDGAPVNLLSDLTLYAQWSVNPQPSEPMDLTVDVTNITNTGAKGVPADIAQQILELSIFIKEGDTIVSRADGVSLDVFGRFVKVRALAHFDRKVDFTKGHYTFAVVVTPHEVFSAPPLSQRYSLSAMAWLDNKGEITLYLTWDDGNHSKPELVRIYALPEDEIGAYHILPDGTKEYLLFHTYDICMAWLGRDDLCRGPERCFHKEHP